MEKLVEELDQDVVGLDQDVVGRDLDVVDHLWVQPKGFPGLFLDVGDLVAHIMLIVGKCKPLFN